MKCGDKVLFMVMDTGRAGCLIVIHNTEEKLYYGDVTIKKAMLKEANNMLHFKYGNSCKFTIKDETLDEIIENSQILK